MKDEDSKPPPAADSAAFLAWLETVPDPERRYGIATSTLEEYQQMVNRLSALRAGAVAAAAKDDSVTSVARRFGVSRQRAYQLLQDAKTREAPSPGTKHAKKPREGKKT
jgi:hypothetical protein